MKLVHPAGLPPADSPFEAEHDHNFTTDAEMVGRLGFAPSSRRLRAGASPSKFVTHIEIHYLVLTFGVGLSPAIVVMHFNMVP